ERNAHCEEMARLVFPGRSQLIAQPEVDGDLRGQLPHVIEIERIAPRTELGLRDGNRCFGSARVAQQEIGKGAAAALDAFLNDCSSVVLEDKRTARELISNLVVLVAARLAAEP